MRVLCLALLLLLGAGDLAAARCADDARELQDRVERQQKARYTPQGAAAMKELLQAQKDLRNLAELDCYNSLARARRALAAPAPAPATK